MRRAALALLLSSAWPPPPMRSSFLRKTASRSRQPRPIRSRRPATSPFPGTIQLTVDASDNTRGIFRIHQHVPVPARRRFRDALPKWVPGNHTPRGQINKVAGFRATRTARSSHGSATRSTFTPSTCRPAGRQRDRRRLPICLADRREPGPRSSRRPTSQASSGSPTRCIRRDISSATFRSRRR